MKIKNRINICTSTSHENNKIYKSELSKRLLCKANLLQINYVKGFKGLFGFKIRVGIIFSEYCDFN